MCTIRPDCRSEPLATDGALYLDRLAVTVDNQTRVRPRFTFLNSAFQSRCKNRSGVISITNIAPAPAGSRLPGRSGGGLCGSAPVWGHVAAPQKGGRKNGAELKRSTSWASRSCAPESGPVRNAGRDEVLSGGGEARRSACGGSRVAASNLNRRIS